MPEQETSEAPQTAPPASVAFARPIQLFGLALMAATFVWGVGLMGNIVGPVPFLLPTGRAVSIPETAVGVLLMAPIGLFFGAKIAADEGLIDGK